ncbi:MAG: hypothetical protein ACXWEY_01605 [Bacteroidia bacterium]
MWIFILAFLSFLQPVKDNKPQVPEEKDFVLVIPFSPQMYTGNGDHFICKTSDVTPGELTTIFRSASAGLLINAIGNENLSSTGLSDGSTSDKKSDVSKLYDIAYYEKSDKKLIGYIKNYPEFNMKQRLSPSHVRFGTDCVNKNSPKPNEKKHSYREVKINDNDLFYNILKKNKAKYAVFLSQFEMNTRFKNCMDLQHNVFQRDFYLHYTLLDSAGNYMDGGVVGSTFQSQTNDINVIMNKNMGMMTTLIAQRIRNKIKKED